MTGRALLTDIYNHKLTPRFPHMMEDANMFPAPGERYFFPSGGLDWFGVHWTYVDPVSQTVSPNQQLLDDISDWENQVNFPDLEAFDWATDAAAKCAAFDRENKYQIMIVHNGMFERLHSLMGFEDALCAFYDDPDALKAFFAAVTEHKMTLMKKAKEFYNPDVMVMHDDWGTNSNMFFSPDLWREFIKPNVKKMVDCCHSLGMKYEQHSCGYITPIVGDLVELGVDSLEPLMWINDVPGIKAQFGGQLTLHGGFDEQFLDSPGTTVPQAKASVRKTLEACAPGGAYIPQVGVFTSPQIAAAVAEEIAAFEAEFYHL